MSRISSPVLRLIRCFSSTASASTPDNLVFNASRASASLARDGVIAHTIQNGAPLSPRSIATSRQRQLPSRPHRRSFRASARATRRLDTSTIDYFVMPSSSQLDPPLDSDPFSRLRVPLLPDNFAPNRSQLEGHAPEAPDAPLPPPEIVVIAAHPENVSPAALTEVEGIGVDGVELGFAHDDFTGGQREVEPGMLTDLWRGLVDDVFGSGEKAKPVP